jgi:pimeloyl-ACP methyl ester carboxylesterase
VLNPNIWRSQQQSFNWQNLNICYQDQGEGPVLLLLHGLPGSSWDWHPLWPMLVGQFRLIAADFPGCGDSDKPLNYDYRLADQADAILSLLNHLNIEHYQIIAHDYGAAVSTELMASDQPPEAVSWITPRLCGNREGFLWRERWISEPSGKLLRRWLTMGLYGRYLETLTGPFARLTTQRLHDSWQLLCAHQGLQVLPRLFNYRFELPLAEELQHEAFDAPVQVISGEFDPLRRALPPLTRLPQHRLACGHFPHLEDPEKLSLLLLDFHCATNHESHAVFSNLKDTESQSSSSASLASARLMR